jgi:hypothetical protein
METTKITSPRRQEASRRNGALSKGPVTPEGKARSSRNAVTHGCLATLLTFDPGEAEIFNCILAEYSARFEPRDQVEHDLVEEIVRAKWQMRQVWAYESSTLALQMIQDSCNVARDWKSLGEQDRRTLAFTASIKDNNTIPNLQRYNRSLALQAERAMKMLMELKGQRLPPAEEPADDPADQPVNSTERKEPSPISAHPSPITARPAARAVYGYATSPAALRVAAVSPHPSASSPTPPKTAAAGA